MKHGSTYQFVELFRHAGLENSALGLRIIAEPDVNTAKNIHKLRVITKRLRSYWQMLNPLMMDQTLYPGHSKLLSRAAKVLTASRENHVNRKLINEFALHCRDDESRLVFDRILALLPVPDDSESLCKDALMDYFADEHSFWSQFQQYELKTDVKQDGGIADTYKKAKKLGKKAIKNDLEAEITHQWRKWSKYLFYQLEVLPRKLLGKESVRYLDALENLNDVLGEYHDLHVLQNIIREYDSRGLLDIDTYPIYKLIRKNHKKMAKMLTKNYVKTYGEKNYYLD